MSDVLSERCHVWNAPLDLLGPMERAEALDIVNHVAWGEMEVDMGAHRMFLHRRLREAAQPGWKSRAGKRRR